MFSAISKADKLRQTWPARLVAGLAGLAISYGFVGLAFDRGSWWWYLLAIIFLVLGIKTIIKVIGALVRGGQSRSAR